MSDPFPDRNHRLLVEILAGDRDMYRLYSQSPEFHAALDILARVLPAVVRLLADEARKTAAIREAALADIMLLPGVLADLTETLRGPDA